MSKKETKAVESTTVTVPLVADLHGYPGTGKSHCALTFPAPIKVFSFDSGLRRVLRHFKDKDIEVAEYPIPIMDTMKPKPFAKPIWEALKKDYEEAQGSSRFKTLVIDPCTKLYEIARFARQEELGRPIVPYEYGEVYARMNSLIQRAFLTGKNLVLIHYLKDEYVDDKNTGNKIIDGYRGVDALVDIVLEFNIKMKQGNPSYVAAVFKKCGYDVTLTGQELENPCYDDIADILGLNEE